MEPATRKLAEAIARTMRGLDKRTPVEQMVDYFDIGRKLQPVVVDEGTYGPAAMRKIAAFVPELKGEDRVYELRDISMVDRRSKKFILEQTAIPMANGQHLTVGHWHWLLRHQASANTTEPGGWVVSELAWLRKESPSADVLDHVEEVVARRRDSELEEVQEKVREAVGLLGSV